MQERATLGFLYLWRIYSSLVQSKCFWDRSWHRELAEFWCWIGEFSLIQFPSHAQAALRVFSLAWTLWEFQVPKPEPRFCPAKLNKSRGAENLTWDLSRRNLHLNLWIIGVIPGIRMLLEQPCHCSNGITAVFLPFLIFFLFVLSNIESNFKNVIQSPFVSHTETQCLKPLQKQRHSLAFYCCLFKSV